MDEFEKQGLALVANGAFNPAIFHPSWLRLHEIINDEELAEARTEVTHREIAQFSIPGLSFDVQSERLALVASQEPFVRILDIALHLFTELLPQTPLTSIGINYFVHANLQSWTRRHRLGRMLAPIDPWGEFGRSMEGSDPESVGGMTSLTMRAPLGHIGPESQLGVTVQPSADVDDSKGIYINVNHHLKPLRIERAGDWGELLNSEFDEAVQKSRKLVNHLIDLGMSL